MTEPPLVPIVPGVVAQPEPSSPYQPQGYAPQPPQAFYQRPPRRPWVIPMVVGLAVLLLAVGGTVTWILLRPGASVGTFEVKGELTLDGGDRGIQPADMGCAGASGYSDIAEGTAVTVSDATGTTVALGRLDHGRNDGSLGRQQCSFTFVVAGVPAGKGFYGVEVSHRGRVQYTEAELTSRPLKLTLG